MNRPNLENFERGLSEPQFLVVIDRIAQANYTLAEAYSGLHASGFADWQGVFRAALETGAPAMAEMLGSQIKDPELREAFYTLLRHTRNLVEVDQQIIGWLAEFAGLATTRDTPDRNELHRRLHRIAAEGSEGPQGPVWATRPEYQVLQEKSRQAMAAVAQAKDRFHRRLEQLLEIAGGITR